MPLPVLRRLVRWWVRRDLRLWYDPAYRLPLAGLETLVGMEPRRADYVAWFLLDQRAIAPGLIRAPRAAHYAELARVHGDEWLESLTRPETLAPIFAAAPSEIQVDELMRSVRLACGATVDAARESLRGGGASLNLLGGFHHASRDRGIGFCPVNDIAVALAALRADGFDGRAVVLDLDAHPPDGTADCLKDDPRSWIGSISGADWGPLPRVDETLLPADAGDEPYLQALESLLARMPRADFAFVIAGGDVLADDPIGPLGLSLDGVRRRDLRVARALEGVPSVWLPGGGYGRTAWRALAGTGLALALGSSVPVPAGYDPLAARFSRIAARLTHEELTDTGEDDAVALGLRRPGRPRLLGYYTAEGIEYALYRYGILPEVRRLGYDPVRLELDEVELGNRLRVLGRTGDTEHLLIEMVLERRPVRGVEMLFVHWLTLRHPRAVFDARRSRLPGQEVPGLGLAREISEVLSLVARRLRLAGVAFRPAWYHTAYAGRYRFRFVDSARQGRFEALVRDLAGLSLAAATMAVAQKRVRLNGQPYVWEADEMAILLSPGPDDSEAVREERERCRFTVEPAPAADAAAPPAETAAPPASGGPGAPAAR